MQIYLSKEIVHNLDTKFASSFACPRFKLYIKMENEIEEWVVNYSLASHSSADIQNFAALNHWKPA